MQLIKRLNNTEPSTNPWGVPVEIHNIIMLWAQRSREFPIGFFLHFSCYLSPQWGYQDTKIHYVKGPAKGIFCSLSTEPFISLQQATRMFRHHLPIVNLWQLLQVTMSFMSLKMSLSKIWFITFPGRPVSSFLHPIFCPSWRQVQCLSLLFVTRILPRIVIFQTKPSNVIGQLPLPS